MISKELLLIIVLICLYGVVDVYSCISCASVGQSCKTDSDVYKICSGSAYCTMDSDVCVARLSVGEPCSNGRECQSSFCSDSICKDAKYLTAGENCDNSEQCSDGLDCQLGICVNPSYPRCDGIDYAYSCRVGEVCNQNKCSSPLANGSLCNTRTGAPCKNYQNCIPNSKMIYTCQDSYSIPEGGVCEADSNCNMGFYCGKSYDSITGYCTPITASNENCTSFNCINTPNNQICRCNGKGSVGVCDIGFKNPVECQSLKQKLDKCIYDNCQSPQTPLPGSCIEKKCSYFDYQKQCGVFDCGYPYSFEYSPFLSKGYHLVSQYMIVIIIISLLLLLI